MFSQKAKIEILATHSSDFPLIRGENLLFHLKNGQGRLKNILYAQERNSPPYQDDFSALTLNDIPLIQVQSSGCPTCESLLAAGYGMPADCLEIRQAAECLLLPYIGISEALKRMTPLIELLLSGTYLLADSDYYPSEGNGHFFWNVPNDFTCYQATTTLSDPRNFNYLPSFPCFLYPSQPSKKHNPSRVEYYRAKLRAGETLPHAITYSMGGFISVLLDGHHRACACALEGVKLPCLTLSPAFTSMNFNTDICSIQWLIGNASEVPYLSKKQNKLLKAAIHGERVNYKKPSTVSDVFTDNLPPTYQKAMHCYPNCWEAAALALYPNSSITVDGLYDLANNAEDDESTSVINLLHYLARQKDTNIKNLVLPFADCSYSQTLREAAFQILSKQKNDEQIEQFFIDYLVNDDNQRNPLWKIASSYWDNK